MAKNTKANHFSRKAAAERQLQLDATDLYSLFVKGTDRRVYPGSPGVPLEDAQRVAKGLIVDCELRMVRKGA